MSLIASYCLNKLKKGNIMVSYSNHSRSVKVKAPPKVVYAPKDSCVVLCPEGRMNLAQFCMLLMTIHRQVNSKKGVSSYDQPEHTYKAKIKGSLISGPFILQNFIKSSLNYLSFFLPIQNI